LKKHILNRISCVILAIGIVVLADTPLRSQEGEDKDALKNGWISNFDDGIKKAGKSGQPLMVVLRCVP
jgi:hypothetical protein